MSQEKVTAAKSGGGQNQDAIDSQHMQQACKVATNAQGFAEPNPTVGCVIAVGKEVIATGWTQAYGSDHAEIHALQRVPPEQRGRLRDATIYVTLEPCCHHGKTPPCTDAILAEGIKRIVVAVADPFHQVEGKGIKQLRRAGVDVIVGVKKEEATRLTAPYRKLLRSKRPWLIAKWAMTLDGKIATSTRDSQWISGEVSRQIVHSIRGRMDGIMVGIGTALADDPLLNARPGGSRRATRIVVDSDARLPTTSQLVQTARDIPVLLAIGPQADTEKTRELETLGVEIHQSKAAEHSQRLFDLLDELGRRRMTNVLIEGGAAILGSLHDEKQIDEVHVFVSPKLAGGHSAISPVGGRGAELMRQTTHLEDVQWQQVDEDFYIQGRVSRQETK